MYKIFFLPQYFYLTSPSFEDIIENLPATYEAFIIRLEKLNEYNDAKYTEQYYKENGKKFKSLNLTVYEKNKLLRFIKYYKNYHIVKNFIKLEKPDLVVVNSDLGGLLIRFFLSICDKFKIKILILSPTDVLIGKNQKKIFEKIIRKNSFFKSIFITNNTLGTFINNCPICVISDTAKTKLAEVGQVFNERITTVNLNLNNKRYGNLEIPIPSNCSKIVALYSETIDLMYGIEYLKDINKELSDLVKKFEDVFFIVKLHPREPQDIISLYEETFDTPNAYVTKDLDLDTIIENSILHIAHYSTVLITAQSRGKLILSLNFKRDYEKSFLAMEVFKIFEVCSRNELFEKFESAINKESNLHHKMLAVTNDLANRRTGISINSIFEECLATVERND